MNSPLHWGLLALWILASLALVGVAAYGRRYWDEPAGVSLSATAFVTGASGLALAAAGARGHPAESELFGPLTSVTYFLVPAVWSVFALEYTGQDELVTARSLAGLGTVATFGIGFLVADALGLLSGAPLPVDAGLGLVTFVAFFGIVGGGIVLSARVLVATYREDYLDLREGAYVTAGWMAPFAATLLSLSLYQQEQSVEPVAGTAAIAGGFAVGAACLVTAVWYRSPFDSIPATNAVSTAMVVAEMDELVVVVDDGGEVADLNPAAERVLDVETATVAGSNLASVLGRSLDEIRNRDVVSLGGDGGTRYYESRVTPLTDRRGRPLGRALVLYDVTDRRLREQRLSVLNRVLRHNVRNDMTAVLGSARRIENGGDPDRMAETIRAGAEDILELSDKAREIERLMSIDPDPDARPNLRELVEEVLAATDAADRADLRVSVPADLAPRADPRLLRPVLANLVENAIEHADTDRPEVGVEAERRDGGVEITVADDGPGIPEQELRTLAAGTESALEHGNGLGLWTVKWGVTRLGGEVIFEEADPRGTVVRIELPGERPTAAEPATAAGVPTTGGRTSGAAPDEIVEIGSPAPDPRE